MRLYNALSQSVEPFSTNAPSVTIYVCGITPYDTTHLGHAFTYTVYDILIRYLESQGHGVRYVQNVTDIDDDILRKAREVHEDWVKLGNRWTTHFIDDLVALNVRPPDFFPRATDVIPEIVESVERLIASGIAYEVAGNVYFHIKDWPEFGKLSHIPAAEMLPIANERGNFPDDPYKRAPLDFVLWQATKPGEPAWDSPWGLGRPGWHIECSTMATKFLGATVDIHGGGGDLLFPHHECEIAQIEPVTGQPFVRFWPHAAMVYHDGEKMSKSLGNLIMIRDLLQTYTPDAIRLYLGSHHYRQRWSHDEAVLKRCQTLAYHLQETAHAVGGHRQPDGPAASNLDGAEADFFRAMADDLNSPAAIQSLVAFADFINIAVADGYDVRATQNRLWAMGSVLGLRLDDASPEERVIDGWQNHRARFGPTV
ncbi:MAG: cysteine--tRNA ligase [Caldilineales bacterium]|nr:cysteine--tRNA ligase [Caldilineales bacterium]